MRTLGIDLQTTPETLELGRKTFPHLQLGHLYIIGAGRPVFSYGGWGYRWYELRNHDFDYSVATDMPTNRILQLVCIKIAATGCLRYVFLCGEKLIWTSGDETLRLLVDKLREEETQ